jgi:uncharacterized membrane protein
MRSNRLIWLFGTVLALGAGFVQITSATLPEHVASHFGAGGQANGFMSRDGYRWFTLAFTVAFPVLIVALIGGLPRLLPGLTNLPNRDYWLAAERREETFDFLARHALWLGCGMVVFMCAIHWTIVQANALDPPRLGTTFFGLLLAMLAGVGVWTAILIRRFRKGG